MFMKCIGTSDSIVERKQDDYVNWELVCELCIIYELYKGNIKFDELISIYCV